MPEILGNTSGKTGLPPGSLIHVGKVRGSATRISVIDYSKDNVVEKQLESFDEILSYQHSETLSWVIIEGLTNVDIVEKIGQAFNIHPLVLEDVLNTHQRPKFEEYDDYLYIVLKCIMPEDVNAAGDISGNFSEKFSGKFSGNFSVNYEQISILVFKNVLFTFKEKTDDLFSPIVQRLKSNKGRLRNQGTDYLTYSILDAIVDQNFLLLDALDETVISLEDELFTDASQSALNTIQKIRREIISIRRHISPVRELLSGLLRSDTALINESTHIYFRDVYDHTMRVVESIETYRDILSGLLDIYISSVSNKMNEVMKVLTVFASIFIPLTFIVGIYGMNFENMPELKWQWAYPTLWVLFITIPLVLLVYFKRKKWL